ncbi:NAD(+) synthase [Planctomyces sp. SH-PL62]|uniref:NAD(+) synthase n=1 Tax=Planctomyces sp. SH-PL62 TaxID=1636152 RepID=UPI00078DDE06|nr:NAD(+) synthase [Planctomyces sp. SH-PL62]AMV40653.1 Glutamine-dependent NAD(+) synthetase [Planctomyces sp. SH-PL62]
MNVFGMVRVACASIRTSVGDPAANAREVVGVLERLEGCDVAVFPELCLTGYTCADLFHQPTLLNAALDALAAVVEANAGKPRVVVVGLPLGVGPHLYNVAAVVDGGGVRGIVPKQHIPNYKEFYERRWFRPATGAEPAEVEVLGRPTPFGIDLLFQAEGAGEAGRDAVIGVEICEDLWLPIPPSSFQALAGATLLLNLSASNETIGKSAYRTDLVVGQSGRCLAAYAYAGSGPTESTTDLVFGGHCLIAENGRLLEESRRVGDGRTVERGSYWIERDVDVARVTFQRRSEATFEAPFGLARPFRRIPTGLSLSEPADLKRFVPAAPFVPESGPELKRRCAEIFEIQVAGLAKRVERLPAGTTLHLGVSGGLDSTLALLVAVKTLDLLGLDRKLLRGLTMPGFGTTSRTRTNAVDLMEHLGVSSEAIDIAPLALRTFQDLGHSPFGIDVRGLDVAAFREALHDVPEDRRKDLVFENVQARLRTFLLMSRGFVVGTGDLSEMALGWSTYNADHMSMYNPNCSIPKTLVRFLVMYVAQHEFPEGPARDTLTSIAETTISPELLPPSRRGEILQSTEDALGPYELHDFFLYHLVRVGCTPEKILFLSRFAPFSKAYAPELVAKTLKTFLSRFFAQQYKRSCVPDGPKVGTVSLSPRGDWRMPSDADADAWLRWARD